MFLKGFKRLAAVDGVLPLVALYINNNYGFAVSGGVECRVNLCYCSRHG